MKTNFSFYKCRFGRRILTLFLVCAFIPTTLLVGFAYHRVKAQLYADSWVRMDKECKTYALALLERLIHLDYLLRLSVPNLADNTSLEQLPSFQSKQLKGVFTGFGLFHPETGLETRFGKLGKVVEDPVSLVPFMKNSVKTSILLEKSDSPIKTLYLLIPYEKNGIRGLAVAQPTKSILWGVGQYNLLPGQTELAAYDQNNELIAATRFAPREKLTNQFKQAQRNSIQFQYSHEGTDFLASGWSLFLSSHFNAPTWTIVLSVSTDEVLSTMDEFQKSFPLIVLLMLWIILFLSLYFIRKTITPLTQIQEATEKVGAGNFSYKVTINSGDEFEQVANSFNQMTHQIQNHLQTLTLIDSIDRSIISSLDPSIIIPRSLRLLSDFFGYPRILLAQCRMSDPKKLYLTQIEESQHDNITKNYVLLTEEEWGRLFTGATSFFLRRQTFLPGFLAEINTGDSFLFLPLIADKIPQGALILELPQAQTDCPAETVSQARQIADQLAIALANANLVSNLEKLSIGAVEALARTVDAKSKWTSGHSERVADLAVRIGKAMKCDDKLLEQLFRGGLLHDIGKIGIPVAILDKPGKLNDEEYATIQTHPEIGGQILEPIEAYQDIIPMIVQHHERYDGKGYPERLAGESISLEARILSVADVYDALISKRPYRDGWVRERVHEFIQTNSGQMFDPKVVEAFLLVND
ncbi:HD domain-containing protein [Desulfobulbus rhabdoformis]|uniref:HD domain-containing phosphohydrolase n=1 Tax=Desulfobulbus rhabdoformis TaxID=34032 RepID=UPI001964C062|nr:HD domain-containing phosphohydrolase [Desulfobulbus rhabdoformis]MBM9616189.1 HD domain-containing protein [Desulfobulbus rhabdoformis]